MQRDLRINLNDISFLKSKNFDRTLGMSSDYDYNELTGRILTQLGTLIHIS